MRLPLATLGLVARVFADLHTLNSMKHLMNETIQYHRLLNAWDGSYFGGISVMRQSDNLVNQIRDAEAHPNATVHERTEPQNDAELLAQSFVVARQLEEEIGNAVDAGISKQDHFRAIPILGRRIAKRKFEQLRDATMDLVKMYSPKGEAERPSETGELFKKLKDHFDRAEAAFNAP